MNKKPQPHLRTIARRLLDLFGVDGKHWIDGDYNDGEGNYCLIGGLEKIKLVNQRNRLNEAIAEFDTAHDAQEDGVEEWNDSHEWPTIREFLMKLAHPYQPKQTK
jgi:hypothetical protein